MTGALAQPFGAENSLGDWGYGGSLGIGVRHNAFPVSLGVDAVPIHLGSSTEVALVQQADSQLRIQQTRSQQAILFDTWLRVEPPTRWVLPYLEVAGGFKMLDAKYTLAYSDGQGTTSVFKRQSTASNWGFGAGLNVLLVRLPDSSDAALYATVGVRRLWGSRTSYAGVTGTSSEIDTDTTLILLGISVRARPFGSR